MKILNQSNDGFYISSQDLKLRGPGDLFGIRQSGNLEFRLGDVFTDASILQQASDEADEILDNDPDLNNENHRTLRKFIEDSGENSVDFRTI